MDPICVSAQSEALVKLQAHKSAFQAWKCVSLVYALVVLVLIGSKRHEVGNDIQQLNGVAQLILSQQQETRHTYERLDNATAADQPLSNPLFATSSKREWAEGPDRNQASGHNLSLGTLLDALESALTPNNTQNLNTSMMIPVPTSTSTGGQASKMAEHNNSSLLMSHMQTSIGRELNGQEVLKAEVDAFAGKFNRMQSKSCDWKNIIIDSTNKDEFKTAKSTLNLSTLLVLVYILSWILMALAVNDARISVSSLR